MLALAIVLLVVGGTLVVVPLALVALGSFERGREVLRSFAGKDAE